MKADPGHSERVSEPEGTVRDDTEDAARAPQAEGEGGSSSQGELFAPAPTPATDAPPPAPGEEPFDPAPTPEVDAPPPAADEAEASPAEALEEADADDDLDEDDAAFDEDGDDEEDDEDDDEEDEAPSDGDASEGDPNEAVDLDEPDEDAPRLRHDEDLDPETRAALEAAAQELEEEEEEEAPVEFEPEIPRHRLDQDAIKVISRLRKFDYEAYLVGGCVRDLMLGVKPKDFDVATSALPEETRGVFSNCRLIGRRFRLAHIYFKGGKVVETATFRANPHEGEETPEDLYIEHDNVYGTAEQDANRRDFTINGLFYDAASGRVIDYVGGREDLERRVIRTIGDPDVRMREDPVRILRAVRFAAKLGFEIDPATFEAMRAHAPEIMRSPPPRVLEEVLRLLRCGAARGAFVLLREIGALGVLLPPIAEYLDRAEAEGQAEFWALLDAMDEWVHESGAPPDDSVLLSVALSTLFPKDESARSPVVDELMDGLVRDARLPRRKAERIRLILGAQRIFAGQRKRRFSARRFARGNYVQDALVVFDIRTRATGEGVEHFHRWKKRIEEAAGGEQTGARDGERRRRRRGGRRRKKPQG